MLHLQSVQIDNSFLAAKRGSTYTPSRAVVAHPRHRRQRRRLDTGIIKATEDHCALSRNSETKQQQLLCDFFELLETVLTGTRTPRASAMLTVSVSCCSCCESQTGSEFLWNFQQTIGVSRPSSRRRQSATFVSSLVIHELFLRSQYYY